MALCKADKELIISSQISGENNKVYNLFKIGYPLIYFRIPEFLYPTCCYPESLPKVYIFLLCHNGMQVILKMRKVPLCYIVILLYTYMWACVYVCYKQFLVKHQAQIHTV